MTPRNLSDISRLLFAALCACTFFFSAKALLAQQKVGYNQDAEREFQYALNAFETQDYTSAARKFEILARKDPPHQKTTASYLMGSRAWLHANQPERAIRLLKPFFIRFPSSMYQVEAILLLGDAYDKDGQARKSVETYFIGMNIATSGEQFRDLKNAVARLFRHTDFEREDVEIFVSELENPDLRKEVMSMWHEAMKTDAAQSTEEEEYTSVASALPAPRTWRPRIGVVLPTKQPDSIRSAVVRDIHDGIRAAIEMHLRTGSCGVDAVVFEMNDFDSARAQIQRFARDERALGLVGGVFSGDSRQLTEIAAPLELPLILPTATGEDLTAGNLAYQMNSPFSMRGEIMADYAVKSLGAKRAAVLAPLETYARTIAEGFIKRAKQIGLNAEVVTWYKPGEDDLTSKFGSISHKLVPPDASDVLFAPVGSSEDIVSILKQMTAHGMKAALLGAGDWNHADVLAASGVSGRRVVFETDFAADTAAAPYREFVAMYSKLTDRAPSKHAVFGYDAASFLLRAICDQTTTRRNLPDRLSLHFDGIRSAVAMSSLRRNQALTIMEYENGTIRKLMTYTPAE